MRYTSATLASETVTRKEGQNLCSLGLRHGFGAMNSKRNVARSQAPCNLGQFQEDLFAFTETKFALTRGHCVQQVG